MKGKIYLYTFVAALGGLLFGFDTAVINGALPFFSEYFNLSDLMKGVAVGSALIGCLIGAPLIGRPGDIFGRLTMLRVLAILYLISAVGSGLADNITGFIVYRFIGGLAIGGSSVLSPLYIAEIAPPKYRGRLTITFQLAIVTGILVAFGSDFLLYDIGENNWRWMFIAECIPGIVFFILLFFVGKSPRWLVRVGKIEEARGTISSIDSTINVDTTIEDIKNSIDVEVINKAIYLFKKPYLRLVIIGIMVGMFNQFTGINTVMYYSTEIFESAGFSEKFSLLNSAILGFVNLLFTLIAMQIIDKVGRKKLLLIGSIGMTFFLGTFSIFQFINSNGGMILFICLIGFIAFFATTQGAVIWVLLSEMFPNNIRARGAAIGSASHWIFNAIISFSFPIIVGLFANGHGTGYVYIFYTIATLVSYFFFKKYLVETKSKSLEELEKDVLID